ncbi:hypothetical protein C8R45DRAFT_1188295 [Mycena sanguinolenta]|nr:hypothetical protein C8R45DRAFT_1188295 [Mycena sanguinolenta]
MLYLLFISENNIKCKAVPLQDTYSLPFPYKRALRGPDHWQGRPSAITLSAISLISVVLLVSIVSQCGCGEILNVSMAVPVIAIFTKFDGLITEAFSELTEQGQSFLNAKNGARPLNTTKFRPSDFVRLDDMRMDQSDCIDLINKTANALSDDTLKLLFVSVQQNNIDLCINWAVLHSNYDDAASFIERVIVWFPHTWTYIQKDAPPIFTGCALTAYATTGYTDGFRGRKISLRCTTLQRLTTLQNPTGSHCAAQPYSVSPRCKTPQYLTALHNPTASHCAAKPYSPSPRCKTLQLLTSLPNPTGFRPTHGAPTPIRWSRRRTVEMIQTPDGRSLLVAALCICFAQTFIDGSAKALGCAAAFAATLDAYVGSSTEATVVDEIRKITNATEPPQPASPLVPERTNTSTSSWFPQPAWLKKRKAKKREEKIRWLEEWSQRRARAERAEQPLVDIIKTYRLLSFLASMSPVARGAAKAWLLAIPGTNHKLHSVPFQADSEWMKQVEWALRDFAVLKIRAPHLDPREICARSTYYPSQGPNPPPPPPPPLPAAPSQPKAGALSARHRASPAEAAAQAVDVELAIQSKRRGKAPIEEEKKPPNRGQLFARHEDEAKTSLRKALSGRGRSRVRMWGGWGAGEGNKLGGDRRRWSK